MGAPGGGSVAEWEGASVGACLQQLCFFPSSSKPISFAGGHGRGIKC